MNTQKVAQGLGLFSLGLGFYEAAAPGHLSRILGLEGRDRLLRFYGFREIGAGAGIFLSPANPAAWVWARVAGDALDLATRGRALGPGNAKRANAAIAFASVALITGLDIACARQISREK